MSYFAGLFDAEGYVSLGSNGSFTIAVEISNETIPILFKENFGGSIYERKRENRKKTWTWKINSIYEDAMHFIDDISPDSFIKKPQLLRLKDYLNQSRKDRRITRNIACEAIKHMKQPILGPDHIFDRIEQPVEPSFYEWLAGFIDGDGNFVCNQYIDNRNGKKYFSHQLSASNIFQSALIYINDRISGSITVSKRTKNPIFKWVPNRKHERSLCDNIRPWLIIKAKQCDLFKEFCSSKDRDRMYEIINQIKHENSL